MEKLFFSRKKGKAFATLTAEDDEDETANIPALRVSLKSENFLKNEVVNYYDLETDIDKSFLVYSGIKRAVGLSRKKLSHAIPLVPATPLARRICGFSLNNSRAVKFSSTIIGRRGSNKSWDTVLGDRWDVLPSTSEGIAGRDTLIKYMTFKEVGDFSFGRKIKLVIHAIEGRYAHEPEYREMSAHNAAHASEDYEYTVEN